MQIKIDSEGRRIFYPWAGRGRVIKSDKDASKILSLESQVVFVSPLAILVSKFEYTYAIPLFAWSIFALIRYVIFVRSLPSAGERLSVEQLELESMRGKAKPVFQIVFSVLMAAYMAGSAAYIYAYRGTPPDIYLAITLALSALFLWLPWWVTKKWQRANNSLQGRRP